MNYSALIENRRSVREFTDQAVSAADLALLKAYYYEECKRLEPHIKTALLVLGSDAREKLEGFRRSRALTDPANYVRERRMLVDYQSRRLLHGLEQALAGEKARFGRMAAALDALSPLKVLGRGYAIARKEDGDVLTSPEQVEVGQAFDLRLRDGSLTCRVEERKCL